MGQPEVNSVSDIEVRIRAGVGLVTLSRPKALNALTLFMIRDLTAALLAWRDDASVQSVAIRGSSKDGPFGLFSAGGDIRFFHQAALADNPQLEDFFTEEYCLDYLIHTYPKPFVAFMDGIVMGGGMGISQGAGLRIVTERTRMAMPETNIGLFPDVGGGYFLSRCPGRIGEYLALTGVTIGGAEAVAFDLADLLVDSTQLDSMWNSLAARALSAAEGRRQDVIAAPSGAVVEHRAKIDRYFALPSVLAIVRALERDPSDWARETVAILRKRSPLMLNVTLEQVRRGRELGLADDLRMERGLMHRCFHLRPGPASEAVEGIRAVVVDKDQNPKWNPSRVEDVTPDMWAPFFESPWAAHAHPLRDLS
jgi:enoyl-CoA hydratase/carnithine racemase